MQDWNCGEKITQEVYYEPQTTGPAEINEASKRGSVFSPMILDLRGMNNSLAQ